MKKNHTKGTDITTSVKGDSCLYFSPIAQISIKLSSWFRFMCNQYNAIKCGVIFFQYVGAFASI